MIEANPPQESHANNDYGREKSATPLENGRCRYVVPVTVCKHLVSSQK